MSGYAISSAMTRACNCIGPQNGDPVCPCAMPAYHERELGKKALEILRGGSGPVASPETPAEKAKRIGVPLIPARPKPAPVEANPVVSICGACGVEMRQIMNFACSRMDCPCFAQVTC